MAAIYEGSFLTLAAVDSPNSSAGLFLDTVDGPARFDFASAEDPSVVFTASLRPIPSFTPRKANSSAKPQRKLLTTYKSRLPQFGSEILTSEQKRNLEAGQAACRLLSQASELP